MPITDLTGTTWQLNESLADLVPDGSDYQSLSFGLTCSTTPQALSNCCVLVNSGDLNSFSTWQEFIAQIPALLATIGATNISSAFNVIDNELTLSSIGVIEFAGNEDDGYWISPNGGWTDSSAHIEGTISFTLDNTPYTLNFSELIATIDNYIGHSLFDTPSLKICDIDGGYGFPGADRWTITGGTAATNSDLIAWLQTNATQVLNYTLKPVSCYTKTTAPSVITDLTGTTWVLNNQVYINLNQTFNVSSNHSGYSFSTMQIFIGEDPDSGRIWRAIYLDSFVVIPQDTGYPITNFDTDPIEFTGGTDATNSDLINWLYTNATLIAPTVSLKPVRYFIKKTGGSITDLTGTTWYFNETLTNMPDSPTLYTLDYTTNGDSSDNLLLTAAQLKYYNLSSHPAYDDGYIFTNGAGLPCDWGKCNTLEPTFTSIPAYRTITFTGGTDATNTDLITWIQANATLISGGQTGPYLQPVILLQKAEERLESEPVSVGYDGTLTMFVVSEDIPFTGGSAD